MKGFTLIELIVTMAILTILASGIIPLSQVTYKRTREAELRRNLRIVRDAIDAYKEMADDKRIEVGAFETGYPKTLEVLVEGVPLKGAVAKRVKFLRRVPRDPMTEDGEWGLRSYVDDKDSRSWGGQDVYDIYSKSEKKALDGTEYRDW